MQFLRFARHAVRQPASGWPHDCTESSGAARAPNGVDRRRGIDRAPDFVHQQLIRRYDLALTLRRRVVRAYPILNLKSAQIELRADSGLNVTARIPER